MAPNRGAARCLPGAWRRELPTPVRAEAARSGFEAPQNARLFIEATWPGGPRPWLPLIVQTELVPLAVYLARPRAAGPTKLPAKLCRAEPWLPLPPCHTVTAVTAATRLLAHCRQHRLCSRASCHHPIPRDPAVNGATCEHSPAGPLSPASSGSPRAQAPAGPSVTGHPLHHAHFWALEPLLLLPGTVVWHFHLS